MFSTSQGNKYQFNSSGITAETLELVAGKTYSFSQPDSSANHPFKLSETSNGSHAGGVPYTNGLNYTQGLTEFNFTPEMGSPDLFYYCSFHSGMGGKFRILDFDNTSANETFTANGSQASFEASSRYSAYSVDQGDSGWQLTSAATGADTLTGFKRIGFSDGTLAIDIDAGEVAGQAYRLYQAAFARTPDMPGVAYHINDMESNGLSITQIAGNFIASPEFKSTYGEGISEEAYINLLYENVLGRTPAEFEVNYYKDRFEQGTTDWNTTLVFFAESPENIDSILPQIEDGIWMPF